MTAPAGATATGYAELHAGGARCRVRHAPGAPVTDLTVGGRVWGTAEGWRDRFPTVAGCTLPAWVKGVGGALLRDGGELAHVVPLTTVHLDHGVPVAVSEWTVAAFPLLFARAVRCTADGAVAMAYAVENLGTVRVPFVWWGALALPLDAETVLEVASAPARVAWAADGTRGAIGKSFRWPAAAMGGAVLDLRRPAAGTPPFALKAVVSMPDAQAVLRSGAEAVRVRWEAGPGAALGVWINNSGWWPGGPPPRRPLRRAPTPPRGLLLGPMVGAPDRLDEALGGWNAARWVEPGDRVGWTVRWEAVAPRGTR